MIFDDITRCDLQIDEILANFQPLTPMGRNQKHELTPFAPGQEDEWQSVVDEQEILQQYASSPYIRQRLEQILSHVPDISPILNKLIDSKMLTLTEWFQMELFLIFTKQWSTYIGKQSWPLSLNLLQDDVSTCEKLLTKLNPVPPLKSSFSIVGEYDPRLKNRRVKKQQLEKEAQHKKEEIAKSIDAAYSITRNHLGEWVIDRGSECVALLEKESKVILVRETPYDRFYQLRLPPELQILDDQLQVLFEEISTIEQEVLSRLSHFFILHISSIKKVIEKITHFDMQWARVRAALTWQGVKPELSSTTFAFTDGFHPVVSKHIENMGASITPIDFEMHPGVAVIIGPNMGGKTVALRTAGVIAVLAHLGFLVPAKSCKLPLFPWIASVMGDYQDVKAGLSSFGAEIARLNYWLEQKGNGLLLLDEIGRGTNPVEGSALSQAVTKHLVHAKKWAIYVTHYHEVTNVEGVQGYRMGGICFTPGEDLPLSDFQRSLQDKMDYRLFLFVESEAIPEQALTIAELLGLNTSIIADARGLVKRNSSV